MKNRTRIHRLFNSSNVSHRFIIIIVMFLGVLLSLLAYTVVTLQKDKANALLIDIAGRQRMLLQKHFNEVFLTSQGISADFASTRQLMQSTLQGLLAGGSVVLYPETDQHEPIPSAPTAEISEKLQEQQNHLKNLVRLTDHFLGLSPEHQDYRETLQTLRMQHALGIHIADEAVKQLDFHSEATITKMIKWEIFIAIFMGFVGLVITSKGVRDGRNLEIEIEERKRAESALRNNELFLDSIVENIPHMIFVKTAKDLRFIRFNKSGEELLGYGRNFLIGKTDHDIFSKPEAAFYIRKDREVLHSKTLIDIPEETIQTVSQGMRVLHTKKIPILDGQGNPQYLLGISEDITERKRAEDLIRKGEKKFRAIYEQAPSGIATLDSHSGQFTQINEKYCDITGYSQEEMLDRTFQELTHPEDLEGDLSRMQQLLNGQISNFQMEKRYIRKNGEIIWIHLTCVPLWLDPSDPRQHIAMVEDITYRKLGEKALQESEERYRALFDDNPSMYFTLHKNGKILSVNKFGAQQLGYSVEELVGLSVIEIFVDDDREKAQRQFEISAQNPLSLYSWELRKRRKDGSVVWVKETARAVHGQNGELVVLIVCEDISERKETEKALQDWKSLTESVLEQLPKGFAYRCLNDQNWTAIYVSNGIQEVTGFPASALLSGTINYDSLMAPGEQERIWAEVQEALVKKIPYENEHQIITRDGGKKWILSRGRFIFDKTGKLLYLDGLNVDITEQKHVENKLRASETRFRSLVDHVPFSIYEIELDGTISSINKPGQTMMGICEKTQIIGNSVWNLAEDRDKVRLRENFVEASQGQLVNVEFSVTTNDQTHIFIERFIPIQGSDGRQVKIVGILEDITERRQAEDRLRESEIKRIEALRQSDELKSALLSSVSHELRTPLTAIKASVSSILGNVSTKMTPLQQEFLNNIDQEINYMSRLVDNLLEMSQLEAGSLVPQREWHLLEDLVEGALRHTEQAFTQRVIDIQFPENVPPVYVDALEIQRVLINLLDNAAKYSSPASAIQLRVQNSPGQISIEVSNDGEPLPEEDLERIFERFYRRKLQRPKPIRGTGLGLSICKGIIEAHGGEIWADSIGSRVTITVALPLTESMATFSLDEHHKESLP